uniref:Uncharacterized protein n=1 Tax=Amphora coffeiformis TaxID=265554 RepID=A0A7S3LDW6_9STRA|mmetsp:Transcript_13276/g.25148  ORF Transcript_13276/g.25148 Transcript_13276/m.25148 type:complete len:219 (+) Transcript_13276:259-915(+)
MLVANFPEPHKLVLQKVRFFLAKQHQGWEQTGCSVLQSSFSFFIIAAKKRILSNKNNKRKMAPVEVVNVQEESQVGSDNEHHGDNKKRKDAETSSTERSPRRQNGEASEAVTVYPQEEHAVTGGTTSPVAAISNSGGTSGGFENLRKEIIQILAKQLVSDDADDIEAAMERLDELLDDYGKSRQSAYQNGAGMLVYQTVAKFPERQNIQTLQSVCSSA